MSLWNLLAAAVSLCLGPLVGVAQAETADGYRLSGPAVHGNLAIYFVHGQSRGGPVPLTLAEALAKKTIEVREIGRVNELTIENTGNEEVFIQAGDIVKGGQQDRVIAVSLLLKPHSGALSIASFCVEQGRWSARGSEEVDKFSSANASLPSRSAKLDLAGLPASAPGGAEAASVSKRQQEIWKSVGEIQGKLANNLGAPVAAPRSRTSLQLALENGGLERAQADYVRALQPLGEKDDDIVGYVFPINGKIRNDKAMLMAASNRDSYFWARFRPQGQLKTGRVGGNPMWNYRTQLVEKGLPRVGTAYELRGDDVPLLQETSDGTVYDLRSGEVVSTSERKPAGKALSQQAQA